MVLQGTRKCPTVGSRRRPVVEAADNRIHQDLGSSFLPSQLPHQLAASDRRVEVVGTLGRSQQREFARDRNSIPCR